jgi:crotonobetainyl-CoA:carnitine CoA-transferase CaiB-like acyl-CoA transferase
MQAYDEHRQGPLRGVRVLDLSRLVAGNMATLQLADHGADVIKIEHPDKGDDLRRWRVEGVGIYWKVYSRNKRSLALDIRKDEGREIFLELAASANVLVESFVPGTLEKWGFGPEVLHAVNPDLILLRVSGWGQTGPYRDRPGFGTLVEAMSGFANLNGYPDRPPLLPPLALADMIAGLYGAAAILTALREIEVNRGKGQVIDLSLFEPIFSMIAAEPLRVRVAGSGSVRAGNQSTHTAPRNVYECGDGGFVALSGSMQSMAERIFDTIGRPELKADPRFLTNDDRVEHRDELDAIIGEFMRRHSRAEVLALFEAAAATAAPILSVDDLIEHDYVRGRGVLVEIEDAELGSMPMQAIVPRLSGTPGAFRRPAPALGEHNREILAELASRRARREQLG